MTLDSADQTVINGLTRATVEQTVSGLKRFLKRSLWLSRNNHYASDVIARLNAGEPLAIDQKRHLAQYISASATLHANDGWSYLGRAISCLLAGDSHRGLHLAYYAELRAAISILASEGIGVFNNKHYVIDAKNSISKLKTKDGTHGLAWNALKVWSQRPSSGALFSSIIRPEGRSLDIWFSAVGGAPVLAPQAKDWFMQWGMDLSLATADRNARNHSSYRPDGIPIVWEISPRKAIDFVRDAWELLEPSSLSSFEQIDRFILRRAVERCFEATTGQTISAGALPFRRFVHTIVSSQNMDAATENRMVEFLLRKLAPVDPAIFSLSTSAPNGSSADLLSLISRAMLLLRVATGSARDLLSRSGIDAKILSFWWQKVGETRGLWSPGGQPEAISDLWADIRETLDDLGTIELDVELNANTIAFDASRRLNVLSSHERVSLWGLCPT